MGCGTTGACTRKRRAGLGIISASWMTPLSGQDDRKDSPMRVCLFEDRLVEGMEPLTLTRPAFELLCGQSTLAARQWKFFAPCTPGVLVRPHLEEVQRHERQSV